MKLFKRKKRAAETPPKKADAVETARRDLFKTDETRGRFEQR